jgi:arylsulfatase A-like enzyme/lysophospholipase L1-like esterase
MKQKIFYSVVCALLFNITLAQQLNITKNRKQQPNIILFLIDDLGWMDVGFNGSKFYETPNIDRLAAEGMKFNNAYAACPVCSPTRASILTGKYPATLKTTDWFGAPQPEQAANSKTWNSKKLLPAPYIENLPLEEVTLAEALKAGGYKTFIAGKWHLGENEKYWPENQGFDINKGGNKRGHPESYFSPYNNPRLTDGPVGEYLGDRVATETASFIEANKQNPFFAYVPFYEVHTPMQAKDSLVKKYQLKKDKLGLKDEFIDRATGGKTRVTQSLPVYAAMVESMDNAIGNILNQLKQSGVDDNTVVVFFSDNGGLSTSEGTPTSNIPLRGGKGWLYEGGIREPMIIKYPPKIKPNTVTDVPVISNDFYPTLLQLAGLPLQPKQHSGGKSLVPLLTGKTMKRDALYWHYPHYGNQGGAPGAAIREGKWKLIEWYENNVVELFDLDADLGETKNIVSDFSKEKQRLLNKLHQWQKEQGAAMPSANPKYVDDSIIKTKADTNYIKDVMNELRKKWPKNRNINLVFHGHSVPSGYYYDGNVRAFEAYPLMALKIVTAKFNYATVNCIRTSIGGENAEQGATRFDTTVLVHRPDILFIDYALNDRKMGLERSYAAWSSMIESALAKNIKVVLLTPTPDLTEDITTDDTALEKFSNQIIALARKYDVALIDSYHIFKKMALQGEDLRPYMSQNNHPNEKGHQLVANEIVKLFGIK